MITFSGLDGAGKSTLIQDLQLFLEHKNHPTTILTMYDDITFYSMIRKIRDHIKTWLGRPVGNTLPDPWALPLPSTINQPKTDTSDKSGWLAKLVYHIFRSHFVRSLCLFLDLLILLLYRFREETLKARILITDRYLYDSLVDTLDIRSKGTWFVRFFLHLAPTPEVPVFVDVPAEMAFQRKQEYAIDYMRWRRDAYLNLFQEVKAPLILPNENLEQATQTLKDFVQQRILQK